MLVLRKELVVVLLVAGVLCLSPMGATAKPRPRPPVRVRMVIPAGPHYLTTVFGTTDVHLTLPADFFFKGSASVDEVVAAEGDPIAPIRASTGGFEWMFARLGDSDDGIRADAFATGTYDTVMVQMQRAVLPKVGAEDTVDLMLEEVHVRSVAPVEITGSETRYYDLRVEITSYSQATGDGETIGYMAFTRDGIASGYFTAEVYAWARYIFTPILGGDPIIYDHDEQLTISSARRTPFLIPALFPEGTDLDRVVYSRACCPLCCGPDCHCAISEDPPID